MDAQVAVIGVGTMGAMALWQMSRLGMDVIGFEQFGLGHDRSAAGGESRIFRTAYFEGPQYVPLLLRSGELWRELEAESGRSLLLLNGGLLIGTAGHVKMRNALGSIEQFALPHEVLSASAVAGRYPQHRLLPGEIAVLDETAGVLRPEFAVLAAARRAAELGARILQHTPVARVEPRPEGVAVHTADRTYLVSQAVITAGPWITRLAPELASCITPRRLVLTWYAAADPPAYAAERFPIVIRYSEGTRFYAFPSLDGGSVKVGGSSAISDLTDPGDLDRNVPPRELTSIGNAVARFLPGLMPEPIRISAYMDAYTPDGHAILGRSSAAPGVWVAGGFSGHGFKMSPAIGQALAELVHHGKTDLPAEHLAWPRRAALGGPGQGRRP